MISKKIYALIAGLMVSTAVMANDVVTVINSAAKTSPSTAFALSVQKSIDKAAFYQGANCADALSRYQETPNSALVVAGPIVIANLKTNTVCVPDLATHKVVFYGEEYFKVCIKAGSGKTLTSKDATFGAASVMGTARVVEDINAQNNTSLKPVDFNGSGAVALQLLSGDLDIGLVGESIAQKHVESGKIECFASTNPLDSQYLGKSVKMRRADLHIPLMVVTNAKELSVATLLNNETFRQAVTMSGLKNTTWAFTQDQVAKFNTYTTDVFTAYFKK